MPDGANVRRHTGTLTVSGDGVGAAHDVLIVVGLLIITSPVTGPVPQRIHVVGSVLAPRGSDPPRCWPTPWSASDCGRQLAASAASRDVIEPRMAWYLGENPRVFNEDITLARDFFRLLDQPASLVVFGDLTILTTDAFGTIRADDGPDG